MKTIPVQLLPQVQNSFFTKESSFSLDSVLGYSSAEIVASKTCIQLLHETIE